MHPETQRMFGLLLARLASIEHRLIEVQTALAEVEAERYDPRLDHEAAAAECEPPPW